MIYKKGETVYSVDNREIKKHIIQDTKFITWIQKLLIDNEWHAADDFYSTKTEAEQASQSNVPSMR